MRKFLLGFALILSVNLSAQQVAKKLTASNGQTIGFYEFKPSDYRSSGAGHPVIIFLHGISERGNGSSQITNVSKTGLPRKIRDGEKMRFFWNGKWESFIVLSPQLSTKYGAWQNFYVDEMIEYAEKKLNIDRNRIFLTGLSLGGGGVWNYASASVSNAKKLAAIAPICGTCQMKNGKNIAEADLPIWAFHAKNDNIVNVSCTQNAIKNIRSNRPGVDPNETYWNDGRHGIWDRVYNVKSGYNDDLNIYEWFLGQARGQRINKKPVAQVPTAVTVSTGDAKLKLDASSSFDTDGRIVKYIWKKISGPSTGAIKNPLEALSEITGLTKTGKHQYELKVIDDRGDWDIATLTVNVVNGGGTANKAPKASAGNDISLNLPTNSTILNGDNSSDPDGKITSYAWSRISGPSDVEIVSPTSEKTEIKGLKEGSYKFKLTVTDDKDDEASDEVIVTVRGVGNKAPISRAGDDQTIVLPTNEVLLDGSASEDSDGKIASYAWSKLSGPSSQNIVSKSSAKTKVTKLVAGTYKFRLTVVDNKKAKHTSDVSVIVQKKTANSAPVARTDGDKTIQLPASLVTLDGKSSSDSDGKITKYAWTKVSGATVKIHTPAYSVTNITGLKKGEYVFRLTVTDNDKATASVDVKVTVESDDSQLNKAPVADAGSDMTIQLPTNRISVDGSNSNDPDGSILSYTWTRVSGQSVRIDDPTSAKTNITNLKAGTYVFRLTVTDNKKAKSSADLRVVVEAAGNKAPIANAGSGFTVQLPGKGRLDGSRSTDPDGSIKSWLWTKVSGPSVNIVTPTSATTDINNLQAGSYVFRLTVTDNKNTKSFDEVSVHVNAAAPTQGENKKPIAKAGNNQTIKVPANSVIVDALKSYDPDGKIVAYEWTQLKGPSALIFYPNNRGTSIRDMRIGTYVFRVTVKDNKGATAYDDVTIRVLPRGNESNPNNSTVAADVPAAELIIPATEKLELFPNPVTSTMNIKISAETMGEANINIYDVSGKMVKRIAFQKTQPIMIQNVNASDLRNGIYHLEVIVDNKSKLVTKFIKK